MSGLQTQPAQASGESAGSTSDRASSQGARTYPDANHGFLNQYPDLFADHVTVFLNAR